MARIVIIKRKIPAQAVAPVVEDKKHQAKFGAGWAPGPNDKPRPCKVCGSLYWRPCDGLDDRCISARWHLQRKNGERPTLPD